MRSPYSGYKSSGFRFCFHVTSIAHRPLFLPLEMKGHPYIQRLLKGESPLSVFNRPDIRSARQAFCEFRKQFDFAYWAAKDYIIRDLQDADNYIPLELNNLQHYAIDIMQKRYSNRFIGRYIITKSFGRVGLTTGIQAYMLWLQIYKCNNHSYTCSASDISINPHKTDLCRFLKRDIVPADKFIYIPKANRKAFFNTYRSPDYIRGINLGYVHFADMSKWHDIDGNDATRANAAASSAVLMKHFTMIVLEGNIPKEDRFNIDEFKNFHLPWQIRLMRLEKYSKNPYFLDRVAMATSSISSNDDGLYFHINLDKTFAPDRIRIPLSPAFPA